MFDTLIEENNFPGGTAVIIPDWKSLRLCADAVTEKHACVSCYVKITDGPGKLERAGLSFCPKGQLEFQISQARIDFGMNFRVGWEIEFLLLEEGKLNEIPRASTLVGALGL